MKNNLEQIINEFKKQAKDAIKVLLPNQDFDSFGSRIEPDCLNNFGLRKTNAAYKNSSYFFDPINTGFIHFTSLEKAKEIISTNKLRLYDLTFVDDINEVLFSSTSINVPLSSHNKEQIQSFLHTISFCTYPFKETSDEFNMWRLYGNDGLGIGLVFEFKTSPDYWYNFMLSEVFYNDANKIVAIKNTVEGLQRLLIEMNSKGFSNDIMLGNIFDELLKLHAFHKHSIYHTEKEVRLLYRHYNNNRSEMQKIYTLNKRNRLSSYIELELHDNKDVNELTKLIPHIGIKEIVLGYRYSESSINEIKKGISSIFTANKRHNIPTINLSQIKQYFE